MFSKWILVAIVILIIAIVTGFTKRELRDEE